MITHCVLACTSKNLIPPHHLSHSQSVISQFSTSSWMISLYRSIFQWEYRSRAAMAARRCAGPTPPFFASSWDLHTHVARFLPSSSGFPNQYLSFVNHCYRICPYIGGADLRDTYLRNPPLAVASACAALSSTPRSSYTVVGGI